MKQFGDAKLLGRLIRRGKKRFRPPWAKAMVRAAQAAGVLLVVFILYSAGSFTRQPTVHMGYLARLNEIARPRVPRDGNAWPYYAKAMEAYKPFGPDGRGGHPPVPWNRSISAEDRGRVAEWVRANRPAWAQCVSASRRQPVSWKRNEPLKRCSSGTAPDTSC